MCVRPLKTSQSLPHSFRELLHILAQVLSFSKSTSVQMIFLAAVSRAPREVSMQLLPSNNSQAIMPNPMLGPSLTTVLVFGNTSDIRNQSFSVIVDILEDMRLNSAQSISSKSIAVAFTSRVDRYKQTISAVIYATAQGIIKHGSFNETQLKKFVNVTHRGALIVLALLYRVPEYNPIEILANCLDFDLPLVELYEDLGLPRPLSIKSSILELLLDCTQKSQFVDCLTKCISSKQIYNEFLRLYSYNTLRHRVDSLHPHTLCRLYERWLKFDSDNSVQNGLLKSQSESVFSILESLLTVESIFSITSSAFLALSYVPPLYLTNVPVNRISTWIRLCKASLRSQFPPNGVGNSALRLLGSLTATSYRHEALVELTRIGRLLPLNRSSGSASRVSWALGYAAESSYTEPSVIECLLYLVNHSKTEVRANCIRALGNASTFFDGSGGLPEHAYLNSIHAAIINGLDCTPKIQWNSCTSAGKVLKNNMLSTSMRVELWTGLLHLLESDNMKVCTTAVIALQSVSVSDELLLSQTLSRLKQITNNETRHNDKYYSTLRKHSLITLEYFASK